MHWPLAGSAQRIILHFGDFHIQLKRYVDCADRLTDGEKQEILDLVLLDLILV